MPLKLFQEKPFTPLAGVKNIIAIAAGKGGVGKSTVTVNLAMALKHLGYKVGILDADLYGPSLRKMLPEDHLPEQKEQRILPALAQGILTISMAYFRSEDDVAAIRAPIANNVIAQFLKEVDWGELDFLLIDFPPGTGDIQLTLAQQAKLTGAIMVTTPQEVALLDVRKAMRLFYHVKVPILGILENMSYFVSSESGAKNYLFGQGGGELLSKQTQIPLLGEIPLEPQLCTLADCGRTLFYPFQQDSLTVQAFLASASRLVSQILLPPASNSVSLKKLEQKSQHTFSIEWMDGEISEYRLSDLQEKCPCAGCKELSGQVAIDKDVSALEIHSVGRYALRIQFTSGCSKGIYEYEMLRKMKG